jgi:hypothetical protein
MKRAGHASFSTAQIYIDLAGETFRGAAERVGPLFAPSGTKSGYKADESMLAADPLGTSIDSRAASAEADGNRTRQRVCRRSSILKFGDGRVAGV